MPTFPSKLGRYQIVKHLANGGMAQVLLARATGIEGFERHVVVKRIHSDRAEDPVFVKMFLDEARLAAQLHHNNIVQVHDIGKEKGEYFFAMEYVHGEDLRKLLMKVNKKKEKVPFEHVVTIVTTAALALHHAHEQRGADRKPLGLVHRDVSPANIIIGYDGNVKVVDFGIAKAAMRATHENTKAGALKGKVSYMSPEQCAGAPTDRRSDVYSLGIVLFELSTIRRLFKGNNDFLTMSAIVQGDIPKPSSYRPDLPTDLEAIILKALALDPADRYQSADEMRDALEHFAAAKGLRTSTGALASYMKQLFGQRPEPWLVDDATEVMDLSPDFDGSDSGAAKPPDSAIHELGVPSLLEPTPSSPIARARKRAVTGSQAVKAASLGATAAPQRNTPRAQLPPPNLASRKTPPPMPSAAGSIPPQPPAPPDKRAEELKQAKAALANLTVDEPKKQAVEPQPEPKVITLDDLVRADATPDVPVPLVPKDPVLPKTDKPPKDDGWTNGSPTTGSGTPLAWPTDATAAPASSPKKKLIAIGGVLLVAAAAALFLVMRNSDNTDGANANVPAHQPEQRVDPPSPPPSPSPTIEPSPTPSPTPEASPTPTPSPSPSPSVEASPSPSPSVEPSPSPSPRKKKHKKEWNGDELFLPPGK